MAKRRKGKRKKEKRRPIVLSIVLSKFIGVLGVTLATSVSVAVCGVLNYITSKKRNAYISLREYVRHLPRWIAGIAVCLAGLVLINWK